MTLAADDVTDKSSAAFTRVVAVDTHRVIGYTWVIVKERTKRAKLKGNNCCGYYFCVFLRE